MSDSRLVVAFDHKLFYDQASADPETTCNVMGPLTGEVDAYIMFDLERVDVSNLDTISLIERAARLGLGVVMAGGRHSFAHVYVVDRAMRFTELVLSRSRDMPNVAGIVWSPEDVSVERSAGLSVASCDSWQRLERLIRHAMTIKSLQCDGQSHLSLLEGMT